MVEAFYALRLIRGNHYDFECMTCFQNYLLIGTKSGQILIYEITPSANNHPDVFVPSISVEVQYVQSKTIEFTYNTDISSNGLSPSLPSLNVRLCATHNICKKRVLQLQIVHEYQFFLALTEFHLAAYSLRDRQLVAVVPNSKGATYFAIIYQSESKNHSISDGMILY